MVCMNNIQKSRVSCSYQCHLIYDFGRLRKRSSHGNAAPEINILPVQDIRLVVVTLRLAKSCVHFSALTRQCDYGMLAADW